MPEYRIINRVHPTPAFAQTVADVQAAENEGLAPQTTEAFRKEYVGAMILPEPGEFIPPPPQSEPETLDQMINKVAAELGDFHPVTRTEFEQLKADLVLAFKKMGFDVSL